MHNMGQIIIKIFFTEADYKRTAEEIVDDWICCTVGIYQPMWESKPCIHCLSVICVPECPKDSEIKMNANKINNLLKITDNLNRIVQNKQQFNSLYCIIMKHKLTSWAHDIKETKTWTLAYHSAYCWSLSFDSLRVITFSWHWARWLVGSRGQKQREPPSAYEPSCAGLWPVWSQHKQW